MLDLTRDQNLLIVFASSDGEVSRAAFKVAKEVEDQLGSDHWVAIAAINAETPKAGSSLDSPIPVVGDLGARIAMRYKARISPTFQIIGKGGTWGAKVEGCDETSLQELELAVGLKAGTLASWANPKAKDQENIW